MSANLTRGRKITNAATVAAFGLSVFMIPRADLDRLRSVALAFALAMPVAAVGIAGVTLEDYLIRRAQFRRPTEFQRLVESLGHTTSK